MHIFRGPASKKFDDESHKLVESKDLSKKVYPWTNQFLVEANISKESTEKYSTANILISDTDVIALHQSLVSGMREKVKKFDDQEKLISELKNSLEEIINSAISGMTSEYKCLDLQKIKDIAQKAIFSINK